jgi:hypothetical protein
MAAATAGLAAQQVVNHHELKASQQIMEVGLKCRECIRVSKMICLVCLLGLSSLLIIIINPCKPYLSASATAPHPLGRRKAD